jgi:Na+-transporting methylmalonyl-CoA/oxaloacetate decarboxylase gamma subunit
MVLPQFSLRMALGLTAVLAFVSLLISRGLHGNPWAMGVAVAIFAVVVSFLVYATVFGFVYLVSRVWNRGAPSARPVESASRGAAAAPREHADLLPPASELT